MAPVPKPSCWRRPASNGTSPTPSPTCRRRGHRRGEPLPLLPRRAVHRRRARPASTSRRSSARSRTATCAARRARSCRPNLLGYSCARVCPVEVLCAGACVYNAWDRTPIAIGRLQRYATETALDGGGAAGLLAEGGRRTASKIACVGAGPASLACAGYLALEGCGVTVREARARGRAQHDRRRALQDARRRRARRGRVHPLARASTIRTGVEVGQRRDRPKQLLKDYDAVFLGRGLGADSRARHPRRGGARRSSARWRGSSG